MPPLTPAWVRDAVFYQIFPDRFARSGRVPKPGPLEPWDVPPTPHGFKGGDLLGIVDRLDDLADLGITALYLTPVFQSASNHRYHTYDYLNVDPLLGGNAALRELLDAAHARDMRVVLDGVFNHCGRGFWPFHHVVENGAASPYRNWFHVDQERLDAGHGIRPYPSHDERARMAARPDADRSGRASLHHLGYRAWWDHPALPKLNVRDPECRAYLLGVAEYWLRFGIDGWRLDVPTEIDDDAFWREFRERARAVNPDAYLVGEIWQIRPEWVAGDRFDALMNYPLLEAVLGFAAGRNLDMDVVGAQDELGSTVVPLDGAAFARRLEEILSAYDAAVTAVQLNLLDSHDTPRFVTMAGGDRAALRLATLVQMTLPGAPCIYYGDELGIEGGHDPDCRRSYPVDRPMGADAELRSFFKGAIALRRAHAVIRAEGTFRIATANGMALAYVRATTAGNGGGRNEGTDLTHAQPRVPHGEAFVVCLNAGEETAHLDLEIPEAHRRSLVAERWTGWHRDGVEGSWRMRSGRLAVDIPPRDAIILRTDDRPAVSGSSPRDGSPPLADAAPP